MDISSSLVVRLFVICSDYRDGGGHVVGVDHAHNREHVNHPCHSLMPQKHLKSYQIGDQNDDE